MLSPLRCLNDTPCPSGGALVTSLKFGEKGLRYKEGSQQACREAWKHGKDKESLGMDSGPGGQ